MARTKNNTTFAAYRVFETLAFLMKQPANVPEITQHLESLETIGERNYSKALIYKYLSTLKFAGIELKRHKCRYEIGKLPFRLNLSNEDVTALSILKALLKVTAEKNIIKEVNKFFYQLNMRIDFEKNPYKDEIKECKNKITLTKEQIKEVKKYEELQKEDLRFKITYKNILNETTSVICEIIEAYTENNNVYLKVYNTLQGCFLVLNTKQIEDIEETPQKNTHRYFSSTTVFKLKGKLAKRYTLREEEQALGFDQDGCLTVASKQEPKEDLFLRLMRYGNNCEVVSPKSDRETMHSLITETLKNYQS